MAAIAPLNSSIAGIAPATSISPPPPPDSPSTTTPPPTDSEPNQSSAPSNTTTAPPPSSPPPVSSAPPPSTPSSPPPSPPTTSPPTSPPPPPEKSPPPSPPTTSPPTSPPPPPETSPPPSPPTTSPPTSPPPPPETSPPPSPPVSPPPAGSPPPANLPPPPTSSPSPPSGVSPTQSPPPPPPPAPSPSPPPPAEVLSPPSANSPPPPSKKSPDSSPPPQLEPSTPFGSPPDPLSPISPPPPVSTSSPSAPASSPRNSTSPAPPSNSSSGTPATSPLPTLPTEKPTAKSTTSGPAERENVSSANGGGIRAGNAIGIGILVGFFVLGLLVMAVWFRRKRKKSEDGFNGGYYIPSPYASSQNSDVSFLRPQNSNSSFLRPQNSVRSASGSNIMSSPEHYGVGNTKWFTYEELIEATNGFSAQNLLGEGGFGCVFKGFLVDGREVAVKQLKTGGGQGEREFRAEVEIISRVHHRHLVSLVGYCISDHQRLLVYDYVPNNTLHYHLHGERSQVMEWATRVKVVAGAARGIAYLHEDCHPRIIHRDIKSSNILLDNNFEAQVADFGLARLAMDTNTHVSTRVMGTFGYLAPEYASTGKLTEKSDVFSFGVVLLELITGRQPVDASQPLGDESLVEWARPLLIQALDTENFDELVDPMLENNYIEAEMFRMIEAAAACIRHLASKRPRMSQVVRALDSIGELSDLNNGIKPGQSQVFDSREQSARIRMFHRVAFGSQDYSSDFYDRSQSSWLS